MRKTSCLAALLMTVLAAAGCSTDPEANAATEGERAPLAGQNASSLNSPTAGPTSEGLPGGTETNNSPELDSDRGADRH